MISLKNIEKHLFSTKRWMIYFCIISLLGSKGLMAQNYDFRDFEDMLPQPYIYSINQSSEGALWIGTGTGLTRFDGFKFEQIHTTDIRNNNFISCSFYHNEQLWFGHFDGTISKLNGDSLKTIYTPTNPSSVTHIEGSPDGSIWASTFSNGFIHINSSTNISSEIPLKETLLIHNFKFISEKKLLIGTSNGLWLHTLTLQGEKMPKEKIALIPNAQISAIIALAEKGKYAIATHSDGIFTINTSQNSLNVSSLNIINGDIFEGIQDIIEDFNQNIWIATFGKGAIKLKKEKELSQFTPEYFNLTTGFTTNNVKTLFEDREGTVWSGSYGEGLTQIINQPFSLTNYEKTVSDQNIYSIYFDGEIKWMGAGTKLLKADENKILSVYSTASGLPNDKITAIYKNKNFLWLGTESNGVYQFNYKTNKASKYVISKGFLETSITAITGKSDTLWIATKKGICKINTQSDDLQWFTLEKGGLPHNLINHIFLDSKNRLWLSTPNNTIAFIFNNRVEKFPIYSNSKLFTIGPITEDSASTIWVGTKGAGVFKIKADSIANVTTNEGLVSNYCYSITADQNGNIWATHKGGISKIKVTDFSVTPIQEYAGINKDCQFHKNAIFAKANGSVWMGSNEGLWSYNPKDDLQPDLHPLLTIRSIIINDKEIKSKQNLELPAGSYDMTIKYMGIQLKTPKNVWYKYQMKGFDSEPTHTQQTSVTYKTLKHGDYSFILSASSDEGSNDSIPVIFNLTIKAPFWKLWWFYLFVSFGIIAIVVIYIAQREHKHKFEKSILESEVKNKGDELTQKSVLLDEKQELIIQQNRELINYQNYLEQLVDERTRELIIAKERAEESDRLKTAFLNNISHEIRTPLHAVCGFSKFLDDDAFSSEEKSQFIKTINENAEELLNMVNEIMDVSLIEANQDVVADEPFVVDDLLTEMRALFQGKNNQPIDIQFAKPSNAPTDFKLRYDRLRFRNIFSHLLDNALKFTESGKILFGYEVFDKEVRFYVSDTGIGIDISELEKIFQPFYKIMTASQKLYRGSGIGLSICKKIVDIMHGQIWIDSEIDKGTVVYFTIPIEPILHRRA